MKHIILLIIIAVTIQCKAQSPVINITDMTSKTIPGAYYKDVNNYLDNFVGTWI